MNAAKAICLASALSFAPETCAISTNPVGKVLQLLSGLEAKIVKEGEESAKTQEEYAAWCTDRSRNIGFEITTGKREVEGLTATIEQQASIAAELTQKVGDLSASIAKDESDLKAAKAVRAEEKAAFAAEEKELSEVSDTLDRAIAVISRELQKGGAAMVQMQKAGNLVQVLHSLVEASALNSADASRLTALVQSSQESDDAGAPDAAVYESHSGDIISVLQKLQDEAQEQLANARRGESTALHNFEMLQQSLVDEMKYDNKGLAEAKKGIAAANGEKANAEGDLKMTSEDLAADEKQAGDLKQDCASKAEDYEAEKSSRAEELKAIGEAKNVLSEMTGGAEKLSYGLQQVSLLQERIVSGADLAQFEAVRIIRDLAQQQHSTALDQLANRIKTAIRSGAASDPFGKVKQLIADMINKLEESASADATHKKYCDEELSESGAKKVEKNALVDKLTTSIDSMTAKSAQLKGQVAALQKALADIASAQAEMNSLRQKENKEFVANKAEMEQGISGVQQAIKILRDYYNAGGEAHGAATGAGSSIIGLLEVCYSDFSKGLAEMEITEQTSQESYDRASRENKLEVSVKEQDVKYKSAEGTRLDKAVAEATTDRSAAQDQLDAVLEYLEKLKEQCVAKAESYSERAARREAEISGLKQALSILEDQSFFQRRVSRHA